MSANRSWSFIREQAFFVAILPLAIFVRVYDLGGKQLWLDELLQVVRSSPNSFREILMAVTDSIGASPLDFIIQHFFVKLLGRSEFAIRLHAAIFGILTLIVLHYLAQMLFPRGVANIVSLLYAVYPLHQHYSQEGRPYALFVLLTVASYYVFLRLLQHGRITYLASYAFLNALMLYTNYFGVFVILSQLLFVCALLFTRVQESFPLARKVDGRMVWLFITSAFASALLLLPWLIFGYKTIHGYNPMPETFNWRLPLRIVRELSDRSYPLSLLLIVLAVFGAIKLRAEEKYGHLLLLIFWFLLPFPLILITIWRMNYFFAIRQILFTTPAMFMLLSYGIFYVSELLSESPSTQRRVAVITTCLVTLISIVTIGLHVPDKRDDLRSVGQFLANNLSQKDAVVGSEVLFSLTYYAPRIRFLSLEEAALHTDLSSPGGRIYLLKSRFLTLSDARAMDEIRGRARSQRTFDFRGVQVIEISE